MCFHSDIKCSINLDNVSFTRLVKGKTFLSPRQSKLVLLDVINNISIQFLKLSLFSPTDACDLTFDPRTAHNNLLLSEGNRKVAWVKEKQNYPNHQERFDHFPQVLASQSLKGRYYWEMEVMEPFSIGVTHKTIIRKGDKDGGKLGRNDKSWCLTCSDDGCFVWHDNKSANVSSHCSRSSRVGVYLDSAAGTLSFYRVSSNSQMRLHTFEDISSDPLYPAVALDTVSSALFCQPG